MPQTPNNKRRFDEISAEKEQALRCDQDYSLTDQSMMLVSHMSFLENFHFRVRPQFSSQLFSNYLRVSLENNELHSSRKRFDILLAGYSIAIPPNLMPEIEEILEEDLLVEMNTYYQRLEMLRIYKQQQNGTFIESIVLDKQKQQLIDLFIRENVRFAGNDLLISAAFRPSTEEEVYDETHPDEQVDSEATDCEATDSEATDSEDEISEDEDACSEMDLSDSSSAEQTSAPSPVRYINIGSPENPQTIVEVSSARLAATNALLRYMLFSRPQTAPAAATSTDTAEQRPTLQF
jgi:hypothetical protein